MSLLKMNFQILKNTVMGIGSESYKDIQFGIMKEMFIGTSCPEWLTDKTFKMLQLMEIEP